VIPQSKRKRRESDFVLPHTVCVCEAGGNQSASLLPLKFSLPCTSTKADDTILCRSKREAYARKTFRPSARDLDLLILRTLVLGPQHGWGISERVQQTSSNLLRIQQGSLYPALHRLERRGWIKAHWGTSDNNRRAKYYELTKAGRRQLEVEADAWNKLAAAMALVLGTA
jgi:PadR family transcriptional regulator, regulatory protein PadR